MDVFDGKKWTNKASISKPTVAGVATFLPEEVESNNVLYLGGGGNGGGSQLTNTIWELDLDKNIYTELKNVPIPRSQQACCTGIKEFGMVGIRLDGNERVKYLKYFLFSYDCSTVIYRIKLMKEYPDHYRVLWSLEVYTNLT